MPRQLHVMLPDEMQEALQAYADDHAISVADAVRLALRQMLKGAALS